MDEKKIEPAKTEQPAQYSDEELAELKKFIEVIKKNESRTALACWGNHSDYSRGY